jgi:hypothetical protein
VSVRALVALAPVFLAGAFAGCSTSSFVADESGPDTVRAFLEAAAARDGATACGLLNGHGQQIMGAYPAQVGDPGPHARSCQQTVSRLGRLPHPDDWQTMARGTICIYGTEGLDSQTVLVIYRQRGNRVTALGSVQPNLGPGFRVMVPPTPARAQEAGPEPQGFRSYGKSGRTSQPSCVMSRRSSRRTPP